MYKILISIITLGLLFSSVHGANYAKNKIRNSARDAMGKTTGFYYYDDVSDANKTKKKKVKASPAQAMQADLTKQLIDSMKENNELQKKILKKLEYAFPNTIPEFTVNKKTGDKCKSNSSADCFVMPVIAEAQNSVPVMKEMLRNPSAKNVKKYMEWQAVYLNQTFKIGKGFSLMNKQYEREMNTMDGMSATSLFADGNKQKDIALLKKSATIRKLGDKLGLMLFVGKSKEIERNYSGKEYTGPLYSVFGDMKNITYVYNSKEDKDYVEARINRFRFSDNMKTYNKQRSIVDPKQFKRFKINATPSSVIIYKKDDGTIIWQKLGYTIESETMIRTIYNFLTFHNIVKPGAINEKDNWEMADKLRAPGTSINADYLKSIDINESNITVEDAQILIHSSKEK